MEIKILSEVEKIWINYDLDNNGTLEYNEVETYLVQRCPHIPDTEMQETFAKMDINNDGHIDKQEMYIFIKSLIGVQGNPYQFMEESKTVQK